MFFPRFAVAGSITFAALLSACSGTPGDDGGGFTPASDDAGTQTDGAMESTTDDAATATDAATEAGGLMVGCEFRATTDVNLREGPSTSAAVLHVIPSGEVAI
ncbi:MAG: hypothetical protein ACXVEE_43970, partial [Polyangiales bacterium]